MESRTLGATGIEVSALALGTWELGGLWWGPVDANDGVALLAPGSRTRRNYV